MTQPAFPINYPSVNGTRHSWSQVEAKFNSKLIRGFTGINYSDSLTPGFVRGAHPQPIDRTLGDYESSADFDMLLAELDNLIATLGNGYRAISFPITVQYLANGLQTISDRLVGCRIVTVDSKVKPSTEGLVRNVKLSTMFHVLNGVMPLPNMLQGNA